jgi:hypothetical protein
MKKFTDWLDRRDETFKVIPSDVGDEIPPQETRGAFPYYSDTEKPPTRSNKITFPKKKGCDCKKGLSLRN